MAFPTASLHARYEANLDTTSNNLDTVSSVPDYSGNGFSLFPVGTLATYRSNMVNGKSAYYLGGSGYYQASTSDYPSLAVNSPTFTISAVINSINAGESRTWPFGTTQGDSTSIFAITDGAYPGEFGAFLRGVSNVGQVELPEGIDTDWTVITIVASIGSVKVYLNGTESYSTTATGSQVTDRIRLGNIVNQTFEGAIAGAYIWRKALDASERSSLHSYVQDTFGITVSDYSSSSSTGQIKTNIAGNFVPKPIKVWNGSTWQVKPLKRWNGSTWVTTPY